MGPEIRRGVHVGRVIVGINRCPKTHSLLFSTREERSWSTYLVEEFDDYGFHQMHLCSFLEIAIAFKTQR